MFSSIIPPDAKIGLIIMVAGYFAAPLIAALITGKLAEGKGAAFGAWMLVCIISVVILLVFALIMPEMGIAISVLQFFNSFGFGALGQLIILSMPDLSLVEPMLASLGYSAGDATALIVPLIISGVISGIFYGCFALLTTGSEYY